MHLITFILALLLATAAAAAPLTTKQRAEDFDAAWSAIDRGYAYFDRNRPAWRRRAVGLAGQEDDEQHDDGETGHEPRLNAARQNAAWDGSAVDDGSGSWRIRVVGHDYRSRCPKASLALPSARYPRSNTFGTTYVPLCT